MAQDNKRASEFAMGCGARSRARTKTWALGAKRLRAKIAQNRGFESHRARHLFRRPEQLGYARHGVSNILTLRVVASLYLQRTCCGDSVMTRAKLSEKAIKLIAAKNFGNLASALTHDSPHLHPAWFSP